MAVTVAGKNYTQYSTCDTTTAGGTWSTQTPVLDAATLKEGAASLSFICKTNGNNDIVFTPTGAKDLSGTKHLRFWFLTSLGGLLQTYDLGGLQVGLTDGGNTGYWKILGRDTYPGGWYNCVIDVSKACDSGTKPTNMNAITVITLRVAATGGKNAANTWVDNLCVCDGLTAYGDDGGGYLDLDDIYAKEDTPVGGGWGVLRKIGGQYFSTGSLDIGFATSATKFQAKSQVLVFENRRVNDNLYGITVIDSGNADYTTECILGSKSGSAGIEGCMVRTQDNTQTCKYFVNGAASADVDNFKLYGTTFYDAGAITLPVAGANVEVLNCNFETCSPVVVSTATVKNCNFVSPDTAGIIMGSISHNTTYSNFIGCPSGVVINDYNESPYPFSALMFTTCTYDVRNNSPSGIVVGLSNASNASGYIGSSVTFSTTVDLTMTVKNEASEAISGAYAYIDDNNQTPFIMNTTTNDLGVATTQYTGSAVNGSTWRVRKYGFREYRQSVDIGGSNISLPVTLIQDPQQV